MARPEDLLTLFIDRVEDYALVVLDPEGRVLSWNRGAERIKGYLAEEILGQHVSQFSPPEERRQAEEALRLAAERGRHQTAGWRVRKDGSLFWGEIVITPLRGDDGQLQGFVQITRDLTERRRRDDALEAAERKLHLLMSGVKEYAIYMMDPEGRVIDWNAAAERLLGYSREEILGQHFSVFFTPEEGEPGGVAEQELRQTAGAGRSSDDRWHVRKDGTHFWANGVTSALRDDQGNLCGYAKVLRDNTERKRIEEELRAKAEALEAADRCKNEFLAMLAHELRNPLAPIANAIPLLRLGGRLGDRELEALEIMERQARRLANLIDDLMDVSRIARGKIQIHRERLDLCEVLRHVVRGAEATMREHRHALTVNLPEQPLVVSGDAARLEQVFENLLHNAAKYTPTGGRIRLTALAENGAAVVRVKDSGVGIAPELLPRVFDLFTQGDHSLDRAAGGLGIGLTIVRSIVELHEGTVEAASDGLNQGSEFTVRLPLLVPAPPLQPVRRPDAPAAASPLRVLVVDDNPDAARLMGVLLESHGHQVEIALCGHKALEAAARFQPQLILLDIGLPGLDGYQVARRLREQTDTRHMVLVALTGFGQPEDRQRSKEAGFDYHLVKPVSIDDVQSIIQTFVPPAPPSEKDDAAGAPEK